MPSPLFVLRTLCDYKESVYCRCSSGCDGTHKEALVTGGVGSWNDIAASGVQYVCAERIILVEST